MKKGIKLLIFLIIVSILFSNLLTKTLATESQEEIYKQKLKNSGLTDEKIKKIFSAYPTQDDLRKAIVSAKEEKKDTILEIPISKLEKEFSEGIITKYFKESRWLEKISKNFDEIIIAIFGGTISDGIKWLVGANFNWLELLKAALIGVIAWCLIWIIYIIERSTLQAYGIKYSGKLWKKKAAGLMWLHFIASSYWKALIFVGIYVLIMSIPIANRVLRIITLYDLTPLWLRPLILAAIFGYLPAIGEWLAEGKKRRDEEEEDRETRVAAQIMKDLGRYK